MAMPDTPGMAIRIRKGALENPVFRISYHTDNSFALKDKIQVTIQQMGNVEACAASNSAPGPVVRSLNRRKTADAPRYSLREARVSGGN